MEVSTASFKMVAMDGKGCKSYGINLPKSKQVKFSLPPPPVCSGHATIPVLLCLLYVQMGALPKKPSHLQSASILFFSENIGPHIWSKGIPGDNASMGFF